MRGALSTGLCVFMSLPSLASAGVVTAPPSAYFDAPTAGNGDYHVVGHLTPPDWSWGRIELLEGHQTFRNEGYNLRTEKLRYQDTYQSDEFPLQDYFGDLNQQLVDAFNLAYAMPCGNKGSALTCSQPGPTRPEARYALLQIGPKTQAGQCSGTPMLLIHGALQDGNVWIAPAGNDGDGEGLGGASTEGPVHFLEDEGICTYAVTFGNFHGDNFNQAIHIKNAISRIRTLTGAQQVDIAAWSKGVVAADLYLANVSTWQDWGDSYFEEIAALSASHVPEFDGDIRGYYALSGPHKGIDLNFRHPYDDLLIPAVTENAPIGRGPMAWNRFSAMQCLTWGWFDSEDDIPPIANPYAVSVCEERGAYWTDYWNDIYVSNIEALDGQGRPVFQEDLVTLNMDQGMPADKWDFDMYNISLFGSVDESGRFNNAYLGQLQVVHDFRDEYPIPCRECDIYNWGELDTDETGWFDWLEIKLAYNPYLWWWPAGTMVDKDHTDCRNTAYEPDAYPCLANHLYSQNPNKVDQVGFMGQYQVFDSLGIDMASEMGGHLMARLQNHGLDPALENLVVVYGTELGATYFETDGMACPSCDPHADGVLFESSIRATEQLTQGWSVGDMSRVEEWPIALGHLEVGVDFAVWQDIINHRAPQFKHGSRRRRP